MNVIFKHDGIKNFYSLGTELKKVNFTVFSTNLQGVNKNEQNLFDENLLILGKYDYVIFPVIFKHKYGKKIKDIIETGFPNLYLISERIKNLLEENNFTGWQTYDVKIFDKNNEELKGYYGFSITGRCGKIDYMKSVATPKKLDNDLPLITVYKELHIGLDEWDGSDIFLPKGSFGIKVTKRVKEVLSYNKITNVIFTNLLDVEISDFVYERELERFHRK